MKKIITSILTLALVASTSTAAFAETNNGSTSTNITVNGTYLENSADVISVDITWDNMDFTYTDSGYTWNPATHEQVERAGAWTPTNGTDPKITVTNHSNAAVNAAFAFNTNVVGMSGSFSETTGKSLTPLKIDTAVGTNPENAPKAEISFSISGAGISSDYELGTITVTVANANAVRSVSTADELIGAFSRSSAANVRLTDNITLNREIPYECDGVINLNGFTLSGRLNSATVNTTFQKLTIKNGTIESSVRFAFAVNAAFSSDVTLEDCQITSSSYTPLGVSGATVTLKNCTINYPSSSYSVVQINEAYNTPGSLTFSGNTIINSSSDTLFNIKDASSTVTCLAGTYNFDPTDYVDTSLYDIVENTEAGIWTVTVR